MRPSLISEDATLRVVVRLYVCGVGRGEIYFGTGESFAEIFFLEDASVIWTELTCQHVFDVMTCTFQN